MYIAVQWNLLERYAENGRRISPAGILLRTYCDVNMKTPRILVKRNEIANCTDTFVLHISSCPINT